MRRALIAAVVAVIGAACTNITLVSVSTSNVQGNGDSLGRPSLSTHGDVVAFASAASNLVAGDTNGKSDVFFRDTVQHITERQSVIANGQPNGDSTDPFVSDNGGHMLAFSSTASNLVPNDTNNASDVFARYTQLAVTGLISRDNAGHPASGHSFAMGISADGSKVLFVSNATNLAGLSTLSTHDQLYLADVNTLAMTRVASPPTCSNKEPGDIVAATMSGDATKFGFLELCPDIISTSRHIFAKTSLAGNPVEVDSQGDCEVNDIQCSVPVLQYSHGGGVLMWIFFSSSGRGEGGTVRVRTGSGSAQTVMDPVTHAPLDAFDAAISPTGRYLAYDVSTTNETPPNGDLRILDRTANTTTDVSVATDGTSSTGFAPSFSPDGTQIGFLSGATNLVPNDTNGKTDVFMRPVNASASATTTAVSRSGASRSG